MVKIYQITEGVRLTQCRIIKTLLYIYFNLIYLFLVLYI